MNRTLFKYHAWMALIVSAPLVLICLTGSILVFKHEIDSWLMPDQFRVDHSVNFSTQNHSQTQRMDLDALQESVRRSHPNVEPIGWAIFLDPGRADAVVTVEQGTADISFLLLNQYTGEVLAPPQAIGHYLTDWLLDLHYALLLQDAGLVLTTIISLIFCALGVTGFLLYKKFWKNFITLRWHRSITVLFNDIHKMIGIVSAPVFLILGFTGGYWNVLHLLHDHVEHAGEEPYVIEQQLYGEDISLQHLYLDSQNRITGFQPTYISLPDEPDHPIRFYGDVPDKSFLLSQYGSFVTYSELDGSFQGASDIRTSGVVRVVDDSFRRLHFGNFAGLWSRVFWSIIGIMPLVLSITGLYVWYLRKQKRLQAKLKRQRKVQLAET
jgi:uncharacterized iron-regulated membrane protein